MTLWRPVAATGVGSMPGTSALESARIVAGELPDLIHVVELPARGPGADMIGRTAAMLAEVDTAFGVEMTPAGWRISGSRGRQMRRASSFLGEDLDALQQTAAAYGGPVKCQVVGPWTLAAAIELRTGERALRDEGAVDDLAHALAAAAAAHVAEVRARIPGASSVLVQWDEPALASVLQGRIGTASGLSSYAPVDPQVAGRLLGVVLAAVADAGGVAGVHCCADDPPLEVVRQAGASFVSVDITRIPADGPTERELGRLIEDGRGLIAGTVPSTGSVAASGPGRMSDASVSAPLRNLLHRLGLEDGRYLEHLAVSPTCGLAGATPDWVRAALESCAAVGRVLRQDEQGGASDEA